MTQKQAGAGRRDGLALVTYAKAIKSVLCLYPAAYAVRWDARTILVYERDPERPLAGELAKHVATITREGRSWDKSFLKWHAEETQS